MKLLAVKLHCSAVFGNSESVTVNFAGGIKTAVVVFNMKRRAVKGVCEIYGIGIVCGICAACTVLTELVIDIVIYSAVRKHFGNKIPYFGIQRIFPFAYDVSL